MIARLFCTSLVALFLAVISPDANGQRPVPRPTTQAPQQRPPASTAGHATAQARRIAAAVNELARARRLGQSTKKRGPADGEEDGAERPGKKKEELPKKADDVFAKTKFSRVFVGMLEDAVRAIKSEEYEADLTLMSGSKGSVRARVSYVSVRNDRGQLKYRVSVYVKKDGVETPVRRLLIHETPGRAPVTWVAEDKSVRISAGDPVLGPVIPGWDLRLEDVIPFDPGRYSLSLEALGMRDGQEVAMFKGTRRTSKDEKLRMDFRRDDFLLLRQSAIVDEKVKSVRIDSDLGLTGKVPSLRARRLVLAGGEETASVVLRDRKLNGPVDPFKFDPSTFER